MTAGASSAVPLTRLPVKATDDKALAKIDAEAQLEKLTRMMIRDSELSGVCSVSQGTWVFVAATPRDPAPVSSDSPPKSP